MLNLLRNSHQRKQDGRALYDGLVARAREPVFFADFGAPDTIDGRFDVLAFHAWMVLAELKGSPMAQSLTDTIFLGFDEAMREQGVGDMGIGHKLKAMAKAFYGRLSAYDAATDETALAEALAKNLWRGAPVDARARALAAYAMRARCLAPVLARRARFWRTSLIQGGVYIDAMTEGLPLSHSYNLARLGNAGDDVRFSAGEAERVHIAKWAGVPSVESLEVRVQIRKLEPNRFGLNFDLTAQATQTCVVTLEPVPAQIQRSFSRELVFVGTSRHRPDQADKGGMGAESEAVVDLEEGPEEINSLHIDLAAPALEEFVLALDPYPRRPGVEFVPKTGDLSPPDNPFAVLKGLK